jgi:cyclic beta-1,2-glucan synthetase
LPIRGELFSVERLELYAATLAAEHLESSGPHRGRSLLPQVEENGRLLLAAYHTLAEALRTGHVISPAAEWLVDNFHIVEEQLREIREDLPPGYHRELPKLLGGELSGYPRIYAVALAIVAHTDSRLDADLLQRFIAAYQRVAPLTIGELWAVAITLRVALIDNLRRLASRIVVARAQREEADAFADKLLEAVELHPDTLTQMLAERFGERKELDRAFVVQLSLRLRDQDPALAPVFDWLEKRLRRHGQSIEQIVHSEHQRQAAAQITVGNVITSMRLLSTLDWRDFFESVSLVDPVLAEDPASIYKLMNFATRDRYRHVVERLSKRTSATELEVAREAVRLAAMVDKVSAAGPDRTHVGFYLIDAGREELEKSLSYRPLVRERLERSVLEYPSLSYLGGLTLVTVLTCAAFAFLAFRNGATLPVLIALTALSVIPASALAVSVLNFIVTHLIKPRLLPSLDSDDGVPGNALTMVVVPTLFTSEDGVAALMEKLEVHYLSNPDENIYFALLADFADAAQEKMPDDDGLSKLAIDQLEELNTRHPTLRGEKRFHLFIRRRLWNNSEKAWMGWERKRGKLEEFNSLLRGTTGTSFTGSVDAALLARIRYVITLDSDTVLPRDAARRLVAVALHPLNTPHYDEAAGRVVRGYGILQPRIGMTLESAALSRFSSVFSGNTGIDPYTTAASDVYQDLFGEGTFTGKGLYDVDAFARALDGRVGENSLLSHDLFEGLYARAALVTDLELFDDHPMRYDSYAKRQHRWARGDWQIARWILPRVPDVDGKKVRNRLPLISRWKILDNLRRTLVPPGVLLWLAAAWTIFPGSSVGWTLFILGILAFPVYVQLATGLLVRPRGIPWSSHFWSVWGDFKTNSAQFVLSFVFIAHQAYLMTDAVVRTLYRQLVSRRRLLEWTTSAQEERRVQNHASVFSYMWPTLPIIAAVFALIVWLRPSALPGAAPILLLWALSLVIAYVVSLRLPSGREPLASSENEELRLIGRRTWRFFETFVGDEDNWLPPDNFQEFPEPVIAHRTSPTNIGLLLLSTLAAHDFGYLGSLELIERLELTFATLDKLPKYRGHCFNWYDTRTLETLHPQYISTVDSGNLAGHLLAVKHGCLEFTARNLFDERNLHGLKDSLALMHNEAARLGVVSRRTEAVSMRQLRSEVETCIELISGNVPSTFSGWSRLLVGLEQHSSVVDDIVGALAQEYGEKEFAELRFWLGAIRRQVGNLARDLQLLTQYGFKLAAQLTPLDSFGSTGVVSRWEQTARELDQVVPPLRMITVYKEALEQISALRSEIALAPSGDSSTNTTSLKALDRLESNIREAARATGRLVTRADDMAQACDRLFDEMEFAFLLDQERKVFVIGYNVETGRADNSYYDLLASESRLCSYIAIAKGDVPQEHWFRLGRQLTPVGRSRALISWTATMFEYLMPSLVMRDYDKTLLSQTYHAVVERQIEYGAERHVPWGVSESAYNARDLQLNYQYGPFGVPGLGLKRGLSEDLVVAPYATMLAALVEPRRAFENLQALERVGALAGYGFYEAIDYTPERLPPNQQRELVRTFMAHHQGMSLVALDNLLNGDAMQRRFHTEPLVQATELLLQERIPREAPAAHPRAEEVMSGRLIRASTGAVTRVFNSPNLPTPRTQLLSNGNYSVMVTTAGAGYSLCRGLAVTRWREDVTRDHYGSFFYFRDVDNGAVWSAGYQPIGRRPKVYEVIFAEDKVELRQRTIGIVTNTEIVVSPEDDAEVRRVSVTNDSIRVREIDVTSYAECVLAPQGADAAHPAFSNLFIETEFVQEKNALIARRRPRSSKDEPVFGVHVLITEGERVGVVQYETDRSRFLGRGHTPSNPVAVMEDRPLSNTVGAVLDPVLCLRERIRLQPGETARLTFTTALASSREEAVLLADKYHDPSVFEREAQLAWTQSQVEMRHHNIDAEEAHLFQRLAGRAIYSDPSLRPVSHVLSLNTKTQSGLWAYGISGDIPIVLARINASEHLHVIRQLLRAHGYLRLKGLSLDLVILNDHPPSYAQALQEELQAIIRSSNAQALQDKPGGIFLRRADQMPEADRILLHSVARVVIVAERGTLEEQLVRRTIEEELPADFVQRAAPRSYPLPATSIPELSFFNGLGGFWQGGREYVTVLGEGQWTPAPWTNVVANEHDFGFQVTESGAGYTWAVNSRENRLTPWSNDAISDPPGEAIYIRDEETGTVWNPTPLPIREAEAYTIRHGQGYSAFEHTSHGISQELLLFVPMDAPVKISLLRLHNRTNRRRRLSVTFYNELVLGVNRDFSAPYVISEIDKKSGAIFASNPYNNEFANQVVFADVSLEKRSSTCDRKEFIGRNGNLARPAALRRARLAGRAGAGLDPCTALQVEIELAPNERTELFSLLGSCGSREEAQALIARFHSPSSVNQAFDQVITNWDEVLETVQVHTPDAAMDTMLNRWLLYQTLVCRIWARSAFYQSGGAYGFRDQLQDVMAVTYARPKIARAQILRAAARQFKEGDVQHWWHPPTGRGVRTRFSDDLLWLPYVTAFYIRVTGDHSVLDEVIPFLDAPLLHEGEDESYTQPSVSDEKATVFEHCLRALDRSLAVGRHGLPLMGSGDWNDGMNRVGNGGKGESVWVGWFLHATLLQFAPLCESEGDMERARVYTGHAEKLEKALEAEAWDGHWYRRAYFDDGTPLGSAQNQECRIDSIAQSWGVISGAADPHRARSAMAAVEEYLIRRGDGLVMLFTPPFDKSPVDPGYIKGYLPGVRENGGQYTHAALWVLIAYTLLGDGDRAGELFAILNPVNHASTRAGVHKYKVEPYVVAADVYAVRPHTGRGGWTWYTGSASWMYRAGLESILGFKLRGDKLRLDPCIPTAWREYEIDYRHKTSNYHIKIENPAGISRGVGSIEVDGIAQDTADINLKDDGQRHQVRIVLAAPAQP